MENVTWTIVKKSRKWASLWGRIYRK